MKKTLCIILSLLLFASITDTLVFATESESGYSAGNSETSTESAGLDENTDTPLFHFAIDFANKNKINILTENPFAEGYKLDTSAFYDMLGSINSESFNMLQWDVPAADTDIAALNLKFELLQTNLKSLGYGEEYELSIPKLNAGYSQDITALFASQFGDLSHKFTLHTLPAGMSMSEIMAESIASRDSMAADFNASADFEAIKDNHSIGDIFSAANTILGGSSTPTLDVSDLSTKLGILTSGMEEAWRASSSTGRNEIHSAYEQNLAAIGSGFKISDEAQRAFNKLVEQNADKINKVDLEDVVGDAHDVQDVLQDNTGLSDDTHDIIYPPA